MARIQDLRVHAPLVIAECAILIFVCSVMVFLRFYARKTSGSSLGLDDCAIAAALAGWPGELLQVSALGCIKLSFLFLYRRVFEKRAAHRFSLMNWFMIAIVTAWMIGYFFTLLFICGTNFKAYWTTSTTEKDDCLPTTPVHLGYAISDVITDVLTILLPIPEIWKLRLPTRRKFAITGVFGLGAVTIAMSIIRMAIYYKALKDITTLSSYFSLLEAGLGLCAACLPVQYALLRSGTARSVFHPATLDSRRSAARTSRSRDPIPNTKNGSQSTEIEVPLPTQAAVAARHEPSQGAKFGVIIS
ncbi:hypothetical protein P7C71_g4129, partial [Lecanoromycetidae sp. Uapishka_2]